MVLQLTLELIKLQRVYVAVPEASRIYGIDGHTDHIISNITKNGYPSALSVNSHTNKMYAAGPETDKVYVIDALTETVIREIQVGAIVGDIALDPNEFAVMAA
jgi:YVTN family beta-propeller protein